MTSRTHRLLAALAAALMLLSACGGDDGDDDDTTTTTAAVEDETTTTEAEAESDDDDDTADTTVTTEASTDDTTDDAAPGSFDLEGLAQVDDFCALDDYGDDIDDVLFDVDTTGSSPEQMAAAYQAIGAFFTRANQIAPAEIRDDLATVSASMMQMFGLLEQYDWDFAAMGMAATSDPELAAQLEGLDTPEMEAASENIDAWIDANCED